MTDSSRSIPTRGFYRSGSLSHRAKRGRGTIPKPQVSQCPQDSSASTPCLSQLFFDSLQFPSLPSLFLAPILCPFLSSILPSCSSCLPPVPPASLLSFLSSLLLLFHLHVESHRQEKLLSKGKGTRPLILSMVMDYTRK